MIVINSPGGAEADVCYNQANRIMRNIKSILVPTDFTDVASNAYTYALRLADKLGASIDLLHCVPPATASVEAFSFQPTFLSDLIDTSQKNMEQFAKMGLTAVASQLELMPPVDHDVKVGDLNAILRDTVEENRYDLIVIGTHGGHGFWDELLGTNTTSLLRNAPCPLLIIPKTATYEAIERVCYATDLRQMDAFEAGRLIRSLFPFNPHLHFVHVDAVEERPGKYDLELVREIFDKPESGFTATFTELKREKVTEAILEYAEEEDCQMIVMTRPDYSFFDELFHKSHTREAAMAATRPLLILGSGDLE
jgi:nucleotide-binding universal stress UspA family protein